MAKTLSTMLELGTVAPDFSLPDVVSGETVSLGEFAGRKALLVMFICRHCPFVKHVEAELARLGADYAKHTRPPARRISSCSTDLASWSIAESSMIVALTTASPSPVQTCAEALMRC